MWRGNHVRQPDQRAILRRLFRKHVERSSGNVAALDSRRQVSFVDELPAGGVDDAHALLHFRNGPGVDHLPCLRTYRRVQGDKIAFGQKLIERHKFHGKFSCRRFADEWIIRNNTHIKRFRPGCHLAADTAKTDKAQSLAAHFGARRRFFPAALAHGRIKLWKLANKRQQQRKGMFRNADGTSTRCAHDQNAALGGLVQVNVIHAHARAAHRAQFFCLVQQIRGDFRRAAHNQGIRAGNLPIQGIFRRQYDVPTRLLLQQLHAAIADLVRYNNFHEPRRLPRVFPAQCK